ncbi:LPXTG cell wall anchor domain-containing protein [Enterococcus mundtii]|uniref:LPXTG cell wall anchor domain-containing protein n=1 Tax=Enterococcus mundtii TaxID=53346 RepID=UPI0023022C4D|nr:LPXTG cell wall anchor domain-containing protein [Enterococcus mundtii]
MKKIVYVLLTIVIIFQLGITKVQAEIQSEIQVIGRIGSKEESLSKQNDENELKETLIINSGKANSKYLPKTGSDSSFFLILIGAIFSWLVLLNRIKNDTQSYNKI